MDDEFLDFLNDINIMPPTCIDGKGCRMHKNERSVYFENKLCSVHNKYAALDDTAACKNYPAYLRKIQEIDEYMIKCMSCKNKYTR
ncbi:hypothetical protein GQ473_06445 [archaeon]|nr:hypothetical protein [archaeon]